MNGTDAFKRIEHIFVLMLENRSFDHMLGFSDISGIDAETGQLIKINGLSGMETNSYQGVDYRVVRPTDFVMPFDPAHEFADAIEQLCGEDASYPAGGAYPAVNNSGFVANYAKSPGASSNVGEVMKCFDSPSQLPVLTALAKEFAVLDNWYASMPGPTWPNRFFAHAASSGGLDDSPTRAQIIEWEAGLPSGFSFEKGTIFDAIKNANKSWRIYSGDGYPSVAALKYVTLSDIVPYDQFASDLSSSSYQWSYTFIEPNYGDVSGGTYRGGNSQHPLDDVTRGEQLIKSTYEAIRNSPLWSSSLLIVTWDEHGGFYDHAVAPSALAPGDKITTSGKVNRNGFTFTQYGPRVPAVVVSPLIAKNVIDHRQYDHASIPATVEKIFALPHLTQRDTNANDLTSLITLAGPRADTPVTLPNPAAGGTVRSAVLTAQLALPPREEEPIDKGSLPGYLHVALRFDLEVSPPAQRSEILARFRGLKTRAEAQQYLDLVREKIHAARMAPLP